MQWLQISMGDYPQAYGGPPAGVAWKSLGIPIDLQTIEMNSSVQNDSFGALESMASYPVGVSPLFKLHHVQVPLPKSPRISQLQMGNPALATISSLCTQDSLQDSHGMTAILVERVHF